PPTAWPSPAVGPRRASSAPRRAPTPGRGLASAPPCRRPQLLLLGAPGRTTQGESIPSPGIVNRQTSNNRLVLGLPRRGSPYPQPLSTSAPQHFAWRLLSAAEVLRLLMC